MLPALLVHGIWGSARQLAPMARVLQRHGIEHVARIDLRPNDGRASIAVFAQQVKREVDQLCARCAVKQIDLVGFSMGALAARYYLQRCGGTARVRRFVSISGPHAGTWTAHALPFEAPRQMRPGSALLRDLNADVEPWEAVEVHCVYTPFDLMIIPPKSSVLRGAASVRKLRVPIHRAMLFDARVHDHVARILSG